MAVKKNLDRLLEQWPFEPDSVKVRVVQGDDGRDVIQMRVDMGILQMEIDGRPDGNRPFGFESFYDYLLSEELQNEDFELSEEQCAEVDREFVQYYHRRVCWLTLRAFDRAVEDADHTLAMMDFCMEHSPDEQWTISHEQYRPFVLFHRIQASALGKLEAQAPEAAIEELNKGLDRLRGLFAEHDAEEYFEEDGLVVRLVELRESLRSHYRIGRTLEERLQEAVAKEQYELAAKLRDEMARRRSRPHAS
ncbi:MAG: UvrB/UvrC motif-containing protein [Pirellulaceae bacterium]|jgi:hypothetical protein|nr:UvrB/UvrC motif-containing protein [Pirellulaceae bacterium]